MTPQPSQLTLRAATQRWSQVPVLHAVDLTLRPGDRVGVVGDNGSGKSTLLGVLAGVVPLADGERRAFLPGGLAYAPQTLDAAPDLTVQQLLDRSPADLRSMQRRLHDLEARMADSAPEVLLEYDELTARFDARAGHLVDVRLARSLDRLGLGDLGRDRPVGTLSGGEQARLALAVALSAEAELLLLDEPTNDLDDAAISWLEQRLLRHRGTCVVVTHDRVFLQRLTDSILEVEAGRVRRYGNGWTGYLTAKQVERDQQRLAHEQWVADLRRNRELLDDNAFRLDAIPRKVEKPGFGHGAFRARDRGHGAMSRIRAAKERLSRLTDAPVAPPPVPLRLTTSLQTGSEAAPAPSPEAVARARRLADPVPPGADAPLSATAARAERPADLGSPVVDLVDVVVDHRLRLSSLQIGPTGRVLVTGPNGAGKTTLLRVITGAQVPDAGRVEVTGSVGHLRQDLRRWPSGITLLAAYADDRPEHPADLDGELLAHGLFRVEDLERPVAELSVGQRRRLELARLLAGRHDLLLLDEPTNHLTPALMDEVEQALDDYAGAVVLVTHDRLLRRRFRGDHLELADGEVVRRSA